MGMEVDDAGSQYQPLGVNYLCCVLPDAADSGDPAACDREITLGKWVAQSIGDAGIAEDQVVHGLPYRVRGTAACGEFTGSAG